MSKTVSLKRLVRRFRRLAGGGNLRGRAVPVKHFFFKSRPPFASGPRCRSACGGELLRFPESPVNTFFSTRVASRRPGPFPVSRSGVGLSTRLRPARQRFFSLNSKRRCPSIRVAASRSGPNYLADPAMPVNPFFFALLRFASRRPGPFPVSRCGGELLRSTHRPVNAFFQSRPDSCDPRRSPPRFPAAGGAVYAPHPAASRERWPCCPCLSKTIMILDSYAVGPSGLPNLGGWSRPPSTAGEGALPCLGWGLEDRLGDVPNHDVAPAAP